MTAFLITVICWSLSNPPGSTHDEWFHLGSTWCANGVDQNDCTELYPGGGIAKIDTSSCVIAIDTEIRRCAKTIPGGYMVKTDNYPNGFYRSMNLFVPLGNSINVLSMRIFNGLLATILLVAQIVLMKPNNRTAWLSGFTLTLVPMGLFLVSSIHPTGWALTGCAHGWMFMITALASDERGKKFRIAASLGWVLCGIICLASRYDAFFFYLVISSITICLIYTPIRGNRLSAKYFVVFFGLVLTGILALNQPIKTFLSNNPLTPGPGEFENKVWISAWLVRIFAIPIEVLGTGQIAHRGIEMPSIVWILGVSIVGATLFTSLININIRQVITATFSLVFLFAVVLWLNDLMYRDLYNLNGRYIIPLMPFMIGLWIHASKSPIQFMEVREFRLTAITFLGLAHAISLYTVLDVFVDGQSFSLLPISVGDTGWWWVGLPVGPNFIWLLGSFSFVQFLRKIWSLVPYVEPSSRLALS